jgi:hypothetical protein
MKYKNWGLGNYYSRSADVDILPVLPPFIFSLMAGNQSRIKIFRTFIISTIEFFLSL